MNYLTIEHVTKTYGDKVLFEDITLHINQGDKMALVAQNGSGKTTLLRLIAGDETGEGEASKILMHKSLRIGYLHQDPRFSAEETVMEAIFDSKNPILNAISQYESAMLHPERDEAMQSALTLMEDLKAWDFEAKIKEVLYKLRITDLEQQVGILSGGQQKRLALAKLIIDEPDFLILDEPTNHLDLDMIEWLEEYLQQPSLTLFMVTHDRYFLERVCSHIVELDRGILHKYSGNYSDFLIKKTTRHENERLDKNKAQKLMKKELEWVRRMPKARGTKAKARIDAFEEIKVKASKDVEQEKVQMDIKGARLGSKILELNYLNKRFGDVQILKDFHYKFKKNERVGIVGANGTGKTTLLRLMTTELRPDSGKVVVGETVRFGFYTQDGILLKNDKRVIDVVTDVAEYIPLAKGQKLTASQLLERFMFDKKHQQVYVSQLSGGERRRLHLLTILMTNPNFLILDEPTNDLDIITLNVLEDFLLQFPGCVIIVSHDRYFMDKLVDHLFVFEGDGKVRDFNGNYSQYQATVNAQQMQASSGSTKQRSKPRSDKQTRLSDDERKEFKRLEREINKHTLRKMEIMEQFKNPDLNTEQIPELSTELGNLNQTLEDKELRWLELAELESPDD